VSAQDQRIERADSLYQLIGALSGEQFASSPLCDDPDATPEERQSLADLFFPVSEEDTDRIAAAKTICSRCPVQSACLQFALTHGEDHGVWGGLTKGERREVAVLRRRGRIGESGEVAA
jgi:WhiB family redox-sensing transcriptional regulator